MNWETILSLGDSITIGSRTYMGYPEYAGHILQLNTDQGWNVFNFAKSGITTVELHRMMANNFYQLKHYMPDLITVLIGTNDAKIMTSPENFSIAYRQILLKAKIISSNALTIVMPIPLLQKGVKLPYFYSMNKIIGTYNTIIKKTANEFGVLFFEPLLNGCHFSDGVHLNEKGIIAIGKQLSDVVLEARGLSQNRCGQLDLLRNESLLGQLNGL